jgi:hypothetical protein
VLLDLATQEKEKKAIRGMKITLVGIERAFARGKKRTSVIEKYEKTIEFDIITFSSLYYDKVIQFEFQISDIANESFRGKYSEYLWALEAKVNVTCQCSDITL